MAALSEAAAQCLALGILAGAMWLIETRLQGRVRLWGRATVLCLTLAALLLSIGLHSGWVSLAMVGVFWLGICGLVVAWLLLRTDIPD